MSNLTKKDWTLLALAAANGQPLSPLQLQKILFLLSQNLSSEVGPHFYHFIPYNYGPFDASVYSDAERLVGEDLVAACTVPGRTWMEYSATKQGIERAEQLKNEMSPVAQNYLPAVVQWTRSLTFTQLLRAIYKAYPQYSVNSVFAN